jgi:hypothetical protein
MEAAAMRVTIVGALVLVAGAILALVVLNALLNDGARLPQLGDTAEP